MLPIILIVTFVIMITFLMFATKKKSAGEDLGKKQLNDLGGNLSIKRNLSQ